MDIKTHYNGFNLTLGDDGVRVECAMPPELENELSAVFFCRGRSMDDAGPGPEEIASELADEIAGRELVAPWQVHGAAILEARSVWALPTRPRADGVLFDSAQPGAGNLAASLRVADCAPVVIASAAPRPWVLALHSGFAGTTLNITAEAFRIAASRFCASLDMGRTFVWIGPCICGDCYERDADDPASCSAEETWHGASFRTAGVKTLFDIRAEIRAQARDAAVSDENIFTLPLCTRCNNDLFYSHRRGDKGRNFLLIGSK